MRRRPKGPARNRRSAMLPASDPRAVVWQAYGRSGKPPRSARLSPPTYELLNLLDRHRTLHDPMAPWRAHFICRRLGLEVPDWVNAHIAATAERLVQDDATLKRAASNRNASERVGSVPSSSGTSSSTMYEP